MANDSSSVKQQQYLMFGALALVAIIAMLAITGIVRQDGPSSATQAPERNLGGQATALGNDASCERVVLPSQIAPGATFNAVVLMRNTGVTTWPSREWYNLGHDYTVPNNPWSVGRVTVPHSTAPGQSANFSFALTAPATPGVYLFGYRMVQDGKEWFGQTCLRNITVVQPRNDAVCTIEYTPGAVSSRSTFGAVIKVQNTGGTTWPAYEWYNLGSQSPADNSNWGTGRVRIYRAVAPGDTIYLNGTFTAPFVNYTNQSMPFAWRMVQDGKEWFGEPCNTSIRVIG